MLTKTNLIVLEVKKTTAGNAFHSDKKCILKNAKNFPAGSSMLLDPEAGKIMAIRTESGWSIDKKICRKYTENLSRLIS